MTWHDFFVAGAVVGQMDWKNRKTQWYEAVSSALNFPFLNRRIASFLMLSIKNEEVSQNCFVFDVVKCKN